jgi:hypothetical protein
MQTMNERVNSLFKRRSFNLIAFVIIAGVVLIAYSNTFQASFHFDDNPAIVDKVEIKRVTSENIDILLHSARPVVQLSLMLNYALGGLNPVGWHVFNIGCHIANSFLVYLLILWTLNTPLLAQHYAAKSRWMALFGALLFAAHPVQTESVTYIISRSELLAAFFYLGAFLLFIQGARKKNFAWFVGAAVSSLLAMQSKEWAVTLPAVLFLYDVLFLSEGRLKPALSRWMAYLLVALPWVMIYRQLDLFANDPSASVGFHMSASIGVQSGNRSWTAWTYLLTSLNVIWTYIRLLLLPVSQNLDYSYPVAERLFEYPTLVSLAGHLAVIGAALWLYLKKGWLLVPFGVAWFYVTLSPVQSFVPVKDVIFEHRLYLPSIGAFIVFIALYEALFNWWGSRKEASKAPIRQN